MSTTPPASNPPPKQLSLIDADIHHLPDHQKILQRMPAALRKRGWLAPGGGFGFSNPHGVLRADAKPQGGEPGSDPDFMLQHHFAHLGIDFGVLIPAHTLGIGVSADYRYAAAACSAYNDYMIDTWLAHDPRFLGSILVAPQWPEAAAKEIRRVGAHPRMVQVVAASAALIPFGQTHYWPIYEAASEFHLPFAVHPGTEGLGISNPPTAAGWPSSYFEWHNALSQNYMAHVNSLVCEGAFQQFPDLTFVAVEGGFGWLAHLMWRMDKNWKALRETVPWLVEPPSAVIRKHVRLTTQPVEEPPSDNQLLQLFEMMHAKDVLLFSSDYPHWDGDDPRYAFPAKIDPSLKEHIFWKNAAALYRLPRA